MGPTSWHGTWLKKGKFTFYFYLYYLLYDEILLKKIIKFYYNRYKPKLNVYPQLHISSSIDGHVLMRSFYIHFPEMDDRGPRVRLPAGAGNVCLHHRVQNGSGVHLASYLMGTGGSFPGVKAAGA
jgi:hypothetical protein